ncbi:MAG: DUF4198 domain-containing protein [Chitinophagales bacterium]|nr:DUF4198 domain-containing protein [Chitinophagales bacterium]
MKNMLRKMACIFGLLSISALLSSHEYILIAEDYTVEKGDDLYVHLFVAQGFNIELERKLQKNITRNFTLETKDARTDLLKMSSEGQLAVIETKVDFEGLALISMERDYARIELPAEEFAEYLLMDHLDNVVFDAKKTTGPQREKYARYLKCLLLSGKDASGDLYKKVLGYHLEIVLLDNPYEMKAGNTIGAKILFMGKPLVNKTVTARNRNGDDNTISSTAKTDENGIVYFTLEKKGTWFIHLTHMIACSDKSDCDWESFWASYSFGIE